eukprot:3414487-Alexandrium_andersonii.AAC.1
MSTPHSYFRIVALPLGLQHSSNSAVQGALWFSRAPKGEPSREGHGEAFGVEAPGSPAFVDPGPLARAVRFVEAFACAAPRLQGPRL